MIYLVEDDNAIRELVTYTLNSTGLQSRGFADSAAFWAAMKAEVPSLIMLDIMLPGEDSLAILRKLRADRRTERIPVMMLTAKGTEYDKVLGLDAGADDYVPKPFGMMELFSRIRAVLRRSGQVQPPKEYEVGPLQVLPARRQALVNGKELPLTPKEFEILRLLISHPGLVLSRGQIQDQVWGMEYLGETRTVDVHIRTLRQKLGACGEYIETVRGVGYRFSATAG